MSNKKLQRLIDKCVKATNASFFAQNELNEYCVARYGFAPGDEDIDTIIDGCMGGNGSSDGMSAEEFDSAMKARKS